MTPPQLPAVTEPAALTAALRKAGVLDAGAVREVKVLHERDTVLSHITRLGLRYVGESAGAPQSLILKTPHAAFAKPLANAGRHEVAYYTQLAPENAGAAGAALLRREFRRGEPRLASPARRPHRQP